MVQAQAIGVEPLREKPAPWFKTECLAAEVGVRHCAAQCKGVMPSDAVFVGNGGASLRETRGEWSSPFVVGKHGTAEECQLKYAQHLCSKPEMLSKARQHPKADVVCECATSAPCHGDVLRVIFGSESADPGKVSLWRRPPRRVAKRPVVQLVPWGSPG